MLQRLLEEVRSRSGDDPRRLEAGIALELARLDRAQLDAVRHEPPHDQILWRLIRHEHALRRGRGPQRRRIRIADRLRDDPPRTPEDLRALLDETAFGDHPEDLVSIWLRAELLARARAALGSSWALLEARWEPTAAQLQAATQLLSDLTTPQPPLPPILAALEPALLSAALQAALLALTEQRGAALTPLRRQAAQITDLRLIVPLLCAILTTDSAWNDHKLRRVRRYLWRSPTITWVLTALLLDPDLQDPSGRALLFARDTGHIELRATIWCDLWRSTRPGDAPHWHALGSLSEPAALVDAFVLQGRYTSPETDPPLPDAPGTLRGLLRIARRKDPRLSMVRNSPGEEAPTPQQVWRSAVRWLPDVALRWGRVQEIRAVLAGLLAEESTPPRAPQPPADAASDTRWLAIAAGRLGEPRALPHLLELLEQGLDWELALALGGLGVAAAPAVAQLEASTDPWRWIALARIQPDDPAPARALAHHLSHPDHIARIEEHQTQYMEGLITPGELSAALALTIEAARLWRDLDDAPLTRAAACILEAIPTDRILIAGLAEDLEALATRSPPSVLDEEPMGRR